MICYRTIYIHCFSCRKLGWDLERDSTCSWLSPFSVHPASPTTLKRAERDGRPNFSMRLWVIFIFFSNQSCHGLHVLFCKTSCHGWVEEIKLLWNHPAMDDRTISERFPLKVGWWLSHSLKNLTGRAVESKQCKNRNLYIYIYMYYRYKFHFFFWLKPTAPKNGPLVEVPEDARAAVERSVLQLLGEDALQSISAAPTAHRR